MILDTLSQIAHDYPYFTLATFLYLFAEIYPEKAPFHKLVKTAFLWLSLFAVLIQFNLIDTVESLFNKIANVVSTFLTP